MKKSYGIYFGVLLGLCLILVFANNATAGPRIEFGEQGFLQMDVKLQAYGEYTDFGSGKTGTDDRTDLHFQRFRLTLTGMINDTWGARFQTCGNVNSTKKPLGYFYSNAENNWDDRDIRIIDAFVIANFHEAFNLQVGLTKIPLTRANLDNCFAPLSLDRSMFVYAPYGTSPAKFSRDYGVVAWGSLFNKKMNYWAAVMEGREGITKWNKPPSGDPTFTTSPEPNSNFEYIGRLHYAFLDPEPWAGYSGTYFGTRKILTVGAGIAYEADAAYRNVTPDPSDNTKVILQNDDTVDYTAYAADIMFEYPFSFGMITATGQYLKTDFDDAYKTNTSPADRNTFIAGLNGQKEGWYAKLAYMFPFTIGKEGKIQPYVLYENWEFAHLMGVNDQKIEQTGIGVNYYIMKQKVRTTLEYLKTDLDTPSVLPGVLDNSRIDNFDTIRVMLQIVL